MKQERILFICTANVCRSPMAEALCKDIIKKDGKSGGNPIEVRSAGISNINGADASDQALLVLRERGIDMSRHKSRVIDQDFIDWADLVLCMEAEQLNNLRHSFPADYPKLHLLSEYCGSEGDISDPSGKPTGAYEECARQLEFLLTTLMRKMGDIPA